MEIDIIRNGQIETLSFVFTGRKAKQLKNKFVELSKTQDENKVLEFEEFLEKFASEVTGLSIDDLDDLDVTEKNKILAELQRSSLGILDFLTSSSKSGP